jgi:hypothetical protein
MESTRGSGTIDTTSATPLRLVMTSVACVSFGIVLVGLSVVSTAIERIGLNWRTLALLLLLTFCGLGLIGIIVQLLAGRTGDQHGALDSEAPLQAVGRLKGDRTGPSINPPNSIPERSPRPARVTDSSTIAPVTAA